MNKYNYALLCQQQRIRNNCKEKNKYNSAGVYSISINNIIVYIGKSKNMLKRIAEHVLEINRKEQKSHKYLILNEAVQQGYTIKFDVLYYSKQNIRNLIEEEIGVKEAEYINKYMPPLNQQIPNTENFKHYSVNKKAQQISLKEILNEVKKYGQGND